MFKFRLLQLLFAVLAIVCVTHAAAHPPRGASKVVARQDGLLDNLLPGDDDDEDSNGGDNPATPTQAPPSSTEEGDEPTSTAVDPTSTTAGDDEDESTTEPAPSSTTENIEPTTTTANDDDEESSSTEAPEPTSTATREDDDDSTSSTRKPVVSTSFETVTRTRDDGSLETSTSETLSTSVPETQEGDGKGGDDGLDKKTRDIIIGVVVGIGGAILLGAIGVVAWRIRSRKKAAEEDASLMEDFSTEGKIDPPGSAEGTNTGSIGPNRSPFQSTLDTYHQPTQPVNTSSNF